MEKDASQTTDSTANALVLCEKRSSDGQTRIVDLEAQRDPNGKTTYYVDGKTLHPYLPADRPKQLLYVYIGTQANEYLNDPHNSGAPVPLIDNRNMVRRMDGTLVPAPLLHGSREGKAPRQKGIILAFGGAGSQAVESLNRGETVAMDIDDEGKPKSKMAAERRQQDEGNAEDEENENVVDGWKMTTNVTAADIKTGLSDTTGRIDLHGIQNVTEQARRTTSSDSEQEQIANRSISPLPDWWDEVFGPESNSKTTSSVEGNQRAPSPAHSDSSVEVIVFQGRNRQLARPQAVES